MTPLFERSLCTKLETLAKYSAMANQRNRRIGPKGALEKMAGRKIDHNLLPAIHKVQIMEFFLTLPANELVVYQSQDNASFITQCAEMLREGRIFDFVRVLDLCRQMAKEDALNTK